MSLPAWKSITELPEWQTLNNIDKRGFMRQYLNKLKNEPFWKSATKEEKFAHIRNMESVGGLYSDAPKPETKIRSALHVASDIFIKSPLGALDIAASQTTGFVGGIASFTVGNIISDIYGLATANTEGKRMGAEEYTVSLGRQIEKSQNFINNLLIYQPKTEAGKLAQRNVAKTFHFLTGKPAEFFGRLSEKLGAKLAGGKGVTSDAFKTVGGKGMETGLTLMLFKKAGEAAMAGKALATGKPMTPLQARAFEKELVDTSKALKNFKEQYIKKLRDFYADKAPKDISSLHDANDTSIYSLIGGNKSGKSGYLIRGNEPVKIGKDTIHPDIAKSFVKRHKASLLKSDRVIYTTKETGNIFDIRSVKPETVRLYWKQSSFEPSFSVLDFKKTVDSLPPVKKGYIRLYRGEHPTKQSPKWPPMGGEKPDAGVGGWYADNLRDAAFYKDSQISGSHIIYIDVPKKFANRYKLGNMKSISESKKITDVRFSEMEKNHEFFFPQLRRYSKDAEIKPVITSITENTPNDFLVTFKNRIPSVQEIEDFLVSHGVKTTFIYERADGYLIKPYTVASTKKALALMRGKAFNRWFSALSNKAKKGSNAKSSVPVIKPSSTMEVATFVESMDKAFSVARAAKQKTIVNAQTGGEIIVPTLAEQVADITGYSGRYGRRNLKGRERSIHEKGSVSDTELVHSIIKDRIGNKWTTAQSLRKTAAEKNKPELLKQAEKMEAEVDAQLNRLVALGDKDLDFVLDITNTIDPSIKTKTAKYGTKAYGQSEAFDVGKQIDTSLFDNSEYTIDSYFKDSTPLYDALLNDTNRADIVNKATKTLARLLDVRKGKLKKGRLTDSQIVAARDLMLKSVDDIHLQAQKINQLPSIESLLEFAKLLERHKLLKGVIAHGKDAKPSYAYVKLDEKLSKIKKGEYLFKKVLKPEVVKKTTLQAGKDFVFDNKSEDRLFRQIANHILDEGKLPPEDIAVLNKYGMTIPEFVDKYIMSVSSAGKTLNALSYMARILGSKYRGKYLQEKADIFGSFDRADTNTLAKVLNGLEKVSVREKLYEVWLNGILSAFTTHTTNFTSNALFSLMRYPELAGAITVDKTLHIIHNSPRRYFLKDINGLSLGFLHGVHRGVRTAGEFVRTGRPSGLSTKFEGITTRKFAEGAIGGVKGKLIRIPSKALIIGDEIFKGMNYEMTIYEQAYRLASKRGLKGREFYEFADEIIKDPPEFLLKKARDDARYYTFQTELGKAGKLVLTGRNLVPGAEYIAPFIRTPTNILKRGLERTPLGFTNVLYKWNKGKLNVSELPLEIAKPMVGSLFMAAVAVEVLKGNITGGVPRDPTKRAQFYSTKQPYSWYIYGRPVRMTPLEPASTPFGLTADFVTNAYMLSPEEREDTATLIARTFAQNITDKVWFLGVSRLINTLSDPERYGKSWGTQMLGSFEPRIMQNIARTIDPVLRKKDTVGDIFTSQTPFLSFFVNPKRNIWGEPITLGATELAGSKTLAGVARFATALRVGKKKSEILPRDKELQRLGIYFTPPLKTIHGVELTPTEQDRLEAWAGRAAARNIDLLMFGMQKATADKNPKFTERYRKASAAKKIKIIRKLFFKSRDIYRTIIFNNIKKNEPERIINANKKYFKDLQRQ